MSSDPEEFADQKDTNVSDPAGGCGCSAPLLQSGPQPSRRAMLAGGAAIGAGALFAGQQRARAATTPTAGPSAPSLGLGGMSVVLLGTAGGPVPQWPRNMTSNAVAVDGAVYLVDCGNGIVRQIVNAGIPYQAIRDVFITHLHPDHMFDYLPTFVCGRSLGVQPGFRTVVDTFGPSRAGSLPTGQPAAGVTPIDPALPTPGLVDTHNGLLDADAYWLNLLYVPGSRTASFPLPGLPSDIRDLVIPHDIPTPNVGASPNGNLCPAMSPFTVFEDSRIKVSAVLVDHPPVFPCYAYRFDSDYGSVVFSGDTTADTSGNMVRLATGADLLVHEAGYKKDMVAHRTPPELAENLMMSHTDVTQLGPIAQQAGVRALALNHLVSLNPLLAYPPQIKPTAWAIPIRKQYAGPVYVGQDLMRFRITSSGVTMNQL